MPERRALPTLTLTLAAGRKSKWIVLVVWLLAALATMASIVQLQDATDDDAAAFLPRDSESVRFEEAQQQLSSQDVLEVTVVYRRERGQLTEPERSRVVADADRLAAQYRLADPQPPAFSNNGHGALIQMSLPGITDDDAQRATVMEIRETVGGGNGGRDGVEVKVTGPGAFVADAEAVYEDIDMNLILATAGIVTLVLLITYRSPVLWLIPLITVLFGDSVASFVVYQLATHDVLMLDGQSAGILPVLVFGVGTDYALLLIARYREELRRSADIHDAMRVALVRVGPTIAASSLTVILAFLALLATDLNSNRSLAVVGSVSIAFVLLASLTLLPALMLACRRGVFWPYIPRVGDVVRSGSSWRRIGMWVAERTRAVTVITCVALAFVAIVGVSQLDTTLKQIDYFRTQPDSVTGQKLLSKDFVSGTAEPVMVVTNARQATDVRQAIAAHPQVLYALRIDKSAPGPNADCIDDQDRPGQCIDLNGKLQYLVVLKDDPDSAAERATVRELRDAVHAVPGAEAVVGAGGAERLDLLDAAAHDQAIAIPLILLVVLVVFCILLRSFIAPLMLMLTVLLSYAAALGACVLASRYLFGFPAEEQGVPLLGFVFLVALGIDYSVFLAIRVREEYLSGLSMQDAVVNALQATGGVITSAGSVLAATFAVLAVLPIVPVTQLGFLVAFGVLLDTFVVRTLLVPAIFVWLGERTWWPSSRAVEPTR
jgi:RND superfamily putative drug exporter